MEEALELLFTLGEELLGHFVRLQGKRWDQDVRELGLEDTAESVEVCVLAADAPVKRLRRDSEEDVVGGKEAALAHLRVDYLQRDLVVVQIGRHDLRCRRLVAHQEFRQTQIFLNRLVPVLNGLVGDIAPLRV